MLTKPRELDDPLGSSRLRAERRNRRPFAVLLLSAGLLVALFAASPRQFVHQIEISVIRQPTPYTQLFFSDPRAVPSRLQFDRSNKFTFTIVNDEGRTWLYHFKVMMSSARSSTVIAHGSLLLNDKETGTRTVAVVPKARQHRYLITVVLDGSSQSIHFYGDTP